MTADVDEYDLSQNHMPHMQLVHNSGMMYLLSNPEMFQSMGPFSFFGFEYTVPLGYYELLSFSTTCARAYTASRAYPWHFTSVKHEFMPMQPFNCFSSFRQTQAMSLWNSEGHLFDENGFHSIFAPLQLPHGLTHLRSEFSWLDPAFSKDKLTSLILGGTDKCAFLWDQQYPLLQTFHLELCKNQVQAFACGKDMPSLIKMVLKLSAEIPEFLTYIRSDTLSHLIVKKMRTQTTKPLLPLELSKFPSLETASIRCNKGITIYPIHLDNLKSLDLSCNDFNRFHGIHSCRNLLSLIMSHITLPDPLNLAGCEMLRILDLHDSRVVRVDFIPSTLVNVNMECSIAILPESFVQNIRDVAFRHNVVVVMSNLRGPGQYPMSCQSKAASLMIGLNPKIKIRIEPYIDDLPVLEDSDSDTFEKEFNKHMKHGAQSSVFVKLHPNWYLDEIHEKDTEVALFDPGFDCDDNSSFEEEEEEEEEEEVEEDEEDQDEVGEVGVVVSGFGDFSGDQPTTQIDGVYPINTPPSIPPESPPRREQYECSGYYYSNGDIDDCF